VRLGRRSSLRGILWGGHVDELTNGDARALGWLAKLFEGGHETEGCTVQNVTVGIVDTGL
jgi:hypothetical protein